MTAEQQKRLETSYRENANRLMAFIRSKVSSSQDTQDLLQDVFVQAINSLNSLNEIDNLTGWLFTIARNKVIDWYRKRRLDTVSIHSETDQNPGPGDFLRVEMNDRWDEMTRSMVIEAMIAAIDELPKKQKKVFVETVIQGKTFQQIADETGESINTLLSRKRYAQQTLQQSLKEIKQIIDE